MSELQDLKNAIARDLYGITKQDAISKGICIQCKNQVITNKGNFSDNYFFTKEGKEEYSISGLCERCFDEILEGYEDEDYPDPPLDSLTCFNCADRETCPFVDDLFNTDGDCLADK